MNELKADFTIRETYRDHYRKLKMFSANSNRHIQHRCHSYLQSEIGVWPFFASIHTGQQNTDFACNVMYYCVVLIVNWKWRTGQYTYKYEYVIDCIVYHLSTRSHVTSLICLGLNIRSQQSEKEPWDIQNIPGRQA